MIHLAEETQVFHFLSCVKFRASSCRRLLKSDMNEILRFPRKFLYQNVDYVKLTNIQLTNIHKRGENGRLRTNVKTVG